MVSLAGALANVSMSAESPEEEGIYLRTVLQRLLYRQLLYPGHGSGWLFVNRYQTTARTYHKISPTSQNPKTLTRLRLPDLAPPLRLSIIGWTPV